MTMSVTRLLSKRDKNRDRSKHHSGLFSSSHSDKTNNSEDTIDPASAADFYGLFIETGKTSSSEESKAKTIKQRILSEKSVLLKDRHILWALKSNFSNGDVECARNLLIAMSNASEGIIIPYDPAVRLRGAVNRQAVTCYLDATLFAMFSRLDSFEAMLYNSFDDLPRNRLAFLLRIWVNLLRAGKLITTDITMHIQDALADCGWKDAAKLRQQDASEAFSFITETLKLPLLTLKMDMYHAGKQDADDHKFINERVLEVAIPAGEDGERKEMKLEDCLEDYFNSRIEVRRFLERRQTLNSMRSFDSTSKSGAIHVETVEVDSDSAPATPLSPLPVYTPAARPFVRTRTPSIIQERFVPDEPEVSDNLSTTPTSIKSPESRLRKGSVRKEVLMPAWQFFSLIPWYTNHAPSTDAQVAAHFSSKRPVLGLCLKRYSVLPNGKAIRLNTTIDIPIEIRLPHFIHDDKIDSDSPTFGNFKLSLQSVVCHRGNSVDSGHYVSLVRGTPVTDREADTNHWMRFDDLASDRITIINVQQALRDETPYLLFYQIMPVDGDPGNLMAGEHPPAYETSPVAVTHDGTQSGPRGRALSTIGSEPTSSRPSLEITSPDEVRGRAHASSRRHSAISFGEQLPVPARAEGEHPEGEKRKSNSFSRTAALVKTLSQVTGARSRGVSADPLKAESDAGLDSSKTPHETPEERSQAAAELKIEEGLGKIRKKDGGKMGKEKGRNKSKIRGDDPDRECNVM